MTARHGLGTVLIQAVGMAFNDGGKVGSDMVQIDDHFGLCDRCADLCRFDEHQGVGFEHCIPRRWADGADIATTVSDNDMLHLHRFQHRDLLAFTDQIADGHIRADQLARHGRA